MSTFSSSLSKISESTLVVLLEARPDLATPAPASLSSLAARATNRLSIEYVLADLNAFEYQVLECIVILDSLQPGNDEEPAALTNAEIATALPDADAPAITNAVERLTTLLLIWHSDTGLRPCPGLPDALGTYPAGLGPVVPASTIPADLTATLASAPPAALSILQAMTWGPPVAKLPARYDQRSDVDANAPKSAAHAVRWLLSHDLIGLTDNQHVVLPRAVGMQLRKGIIYRDTHLAPPAELAAETEASYRDAQGAHEATEAVRLMARLLEELNHQPAQPIRSGALAQRELRRIRLALQTDEGITLRLLELSAAAGFIGLTRHPDVSFSLTPAGQAWLGHGLGQRWAELAQHWLVSPRASWLIGTSAPSGSEQLGVCDPNHAWNWLPRVKQRFLDLLLETQDKQLPVGQLDDFFAWYRPSLIPTSHAADTLTQVTAEAVWLGLYAPYGLTTAARALLSDADPAATLEAALPSLVPDMIIQSDLTAIIPGRPTPDLHRLIEASAVVESRGAALTIRFTEASITAALDTGYSADRLLDQFASYSRTPVPQPLEYLVIDTARRHGALRVGLASTYLRVDDPVTAELILTNDALLSLGLQHIAPSVIVSQADPQEFIEALRAQGFSPSSDPIPVVSPGTGTAGTKAQKPTSSIMARMSRHQPTHWQAHSDMLQRHRELAKRLKAAAQQRGTGERGTVQRANSVPKPATNGATGTGGSSATSGTTEAASAAEIDAGGGAGSREASHIVLQLREAIADSSAITIEVVGSKGLPETRRIVPMSLEAGRLRGLDVQRETELTIALHRVSAVTTDSADSVVMSDD